MKPKEVTIRPGDKLNITVAVDGSIVMWMAERFKPLLHDESERIYTIALSHLVGISDIEAIREANQYAEEHNWPERATVTEFRKWLPVVLSRLFEQELSRVVDAKSNCYN